VSLVNITDLEDKVFAWIKANKTATVKAIMERQNAPRPKKGNPPAKGTYITVRINTITSPGDDEPSLANENGEIFLNGTRDFVVMLQAFRKDSQSELEKLRTSLFKPTVREALDADDIAFVNEISGVSNISGLLDDTQEERGSLDLQFRIGSQVIDTPSFIGTVESEGTFTSPNKSDVEVPVDVTEPSP